LRIQAETLRPPLGEAPLGALLEVLLGVLLVEVGVLELLETADVDISVSSEIGDLTRNVSTFCHPMAHIGLTLQTLGGAEISREPIDRIAQSCSPSPLSWVMDETPLWATNDQQARL